MTRPDPSSSGPPQVLFDTSVLVAGIVAAHPAHALALPWLQRAHRGSIGFLVATHTVAELYAVLSTLPVRPRIGPGLARQLVRENVLAKAKVVSLSAADYEAVIDEVADLGLSGGIVYDALLARAFRKSGGGKLLTLNPRDFVRAWPAGAPDVVRP